MAYSALSLHCRVSCQRIALGKHPTVKDSYARVMSLRNLCQKLVLFYCCINAHTVIKK